MGRKKPKSSSKHDHAQSPQPIDLDPQQTGALLERVKDGLGDGDYQVVKAAFETIDFLMRLIEAKNASISRLRQVFSGWRSEKTAKVLKEDKEEESSEKEEEPETSQEKNEKPDTKEKPKPKGHGRNGADAYADSDKVEIAHDQLKTGDPCPECPKGKVYPLAEPAKIVRVVGQAPLGALVYELERLRCNLCGEIFTAVGPDELFTATEVSSVDRNTHTEDGESTETKTKKTKLAKYAETAVSMIALMKYGSGFPWFRMEKLQENMRIPLPASTQWDIMKKAAGLLKPVLEALKKHAAQGELFHNDDTTMNVLELKKLSRGKSERRGVFTTGILSITGQYKVALFLTGNKHAGENLEDLLKQRDEDRSPPIQMCDALSRNAPKAFKTLLANCLSHGRRKFVEVHEAFPEPCRHVLESLREVYINDDIARTQQMSAQERLEFHQEKSGPVMKQLHAWLEEQLKEKKVEPNSGIGQAITYLLKHWEKLTLFLRVPKAPLDNNICERALKKAILHRKNSLFYKTKHGASVGDLFMSLIYTCHLNGINAYHYLTELQKHSSELLENPENWLPWNYEETILALA